MADTTKILMATVYVKSRSGRSLLREKKSAPVDPSPYLPAPETIEEAVVALQGLGFSIEARGATLSISGPPELFERTCGVRISFEERKVPSPRKAAGQGQGVAKSSQPVMHIQQLEEVIDGIVFAIPGVLFENSSVPIVSMNEI